MCDGYVKKGGFLFLSKTNTDNIGPTLRRRVSSKQTMTNSQAGLKAVSKTATKAHISSNTALAPLQLERSSIRGRTAHTSTHLVSPPNTHKPSEEGVQLTILNPSTILHQNSTLFNNVLPLTHLLLCTMTIGICSIMAKNP
jgi:hypothetical protein